MARAIWNGCIALGLVSIPVALHTAVRDSRSRFRILLDEGRFGILTTADRKTSARSSTRRTGAA